jgi:carboxylesterase
MLLHGFTGQTDELRGPAELLQQNGLTVFVPRLPGHGTNSRDFRTTGWRDWLGSATDAYLELAAEFEDVMVGGLSMGGLISTIIAARFPVSRVALLAPAFFTTNPLVPFTPLLRFFVPPIPKTKPEEKEDPVQQFLADEYWNWQWPTQTASLYRLMRMARRSLRHFSVPILTVVSKKDETVPLKVARYIEKWSPSVEKKTVVLEESGHVVTTGVEKERVAALVADWFVSDGSGSSTGLGNTPIK